MVTPKARRARKRQPSIEGLLRQEIELLRAEVSTLKSYLADRNEEIRRYEVGAAWTKSREEEKEIKP